jgi:hypothetical protein
MSYDRRGDDRRSGERRNAAENLTQEELLAHYLEDISARLRDACAHLTEDEFDALVEEIARMRLRFDEIEAKPGAFNPLRRSSGEK